MHDPLDTLVKRWKQEPVDLLPGELPHAVIAAFRRVGMQATPDVIDLYRRVGGMREMDGAYWRLWSLADIVDGQDARSSEFGPVFADYMISCWDYRLKPSVSGGSAVYADAYSDRPPVLVAPSLEAFFAMYLVDADTLMMKTA